MFAAGVEDVKVRVVEVYGEKEREGSLEEAEIEVARRAVCRCGAEVAVGRRLVSERAKGARKDMAAAADVDGDRNIMYARIAIAEEMNIDLVLILFIYSRLHYRMVFWLSSFQCSAYSLFGFALLCQLVQLWLRAAPAT